MKYFRRPVSEFPNDNNALHEGTTWVTLEPLSGPRPVVTSAALAAGLIEVERNGPLPALPPPPCPEDDSLPATLTELDFTRPGADTDRLGPEVPTLFCGGPLFSIAAEPFAPVDDSAVDDAVAYDLPPVVGVPVAAPSLAELSLADQWCAERSLSAKVISALEPPTVTKGREWVPYFPPPLDLWDGCALDSTPTILPVAPKKPTPFVSIPRLAKLTRSSFDPRAGRPLAQTAALRRPVNPNPGTETHALGSCEIAGEPPVGSELPAPILHIPLQHLPSLRPVSPARATFVRSTFEHAPLEQTTAFASSSAAADHIPEQITSSVPTLLLGLELPSLDEFESQEVEALTLGLLHATAADLGELPSSEGTVKGAPLAEDNLYSFLDELEALRDSVADAMLALTPITAPPSALGASLDAVLAGTLDAALVGVSAAQLSAPTDTFVPGIDSVTSVTGSEAMTPVSGMAVVTSVSGIDAVTSASGVDVEAALLAAFADEPEFGLDVAAGSVEPSVSVESVAGMDIEASVSVESVAGMDVEAALLAAFADEPEFDLDVAAGSVEVAVASLPSEEHTLDVSRIAAVTEPNFLDALEASLAAAFNDAAFDDAVLALEPEPAPFALVQQRCDLTSLLAHQRKRTVGVVQAVPHPFEHVARSAEVSVTVTLAELAPLGTLAPASAPPAPLDALELELTPPPAVTLSEAPVSGARPRLYVTATPPAVEEIAAQAPVQDAYLAFERALTEVAMAHGATKAAISIPTLLSGKKLTESDLSEDVLHALSASGVLEARAPFWIPTTQFTDCVQSWRLLLRGESSDFSAVGDSTLDGWSTDMMAALLGVTPSQIRPSLRKAGIAAFGMRRAA